MIKTALTALFIYAAFVFFVYKLQDKLLFHPNLQPRDFTGLGHRIQTFSIQADKDTVLEAVGFKAENSDKTAKTIYYFSGNADDSIQILSILARRYPAYNWVTYSYRGYGKSGGKPNLKNLKEDTLLFYNRVKDFFNSEEEILFGYSLGSGAAAHLASKVEFSKIILATPFDSIANVSRSHFPWIPFINELLNYRLNSVEYLKNVQSPVAILALRTDMVVPVRHARKLKERINNLLYYKEFEDIAHGDFIHDVQVIKEIGELLQ